MPITTNPYTENAQTALNILTSQWFHSDAPNNWIPSDYWRVPTICRTLIAAMEQFGTDHYVDTILNAYSAGNKWTDSCSYYDDLSVWGGMYTKGYFLLKSLGSTSYAANFQSGAQDVCSQLAQAADSVCGGGDWWKRSPTSYSDDPKTSNFKASNSTIGWAEAAADLYIITGNESYLSNAQTAMDWVISKQLIKEDGSVWGGLLSDCTTNPNNTPVIALQGNPLAPLWNLYKILNEPSYLAIAQNIVDWTFANLTFPGNIMMTKVDSDWSNEDMTWKHAHSGSCLFKGIFSMYLGAFILNLLQSGQSGQIAVGKKYAALLQLNADELWQNYPGHIFSMDWSAPSPTYTPTGDSALDAVLQYSGCSVLLSAATVTDALHKLQNEN